MRATKEMLAIARTGRGEATATRFIRGQYTSKKAFADDVRGNGYRVVHIFDHIADEEEIEDWLFWNRKNS